MVGAHIYITRLEEEDSPTRGNFIALVTSTRNANRKLQRQVMKAMKAASKLPVYSISAPSLLPGIDFSDHLNYWKYKYPAVMITDTSFYRNANYHKPTDTPDTLDYVRMTEVIKGTYHAMIRLAR